MVKHKYINPKLVHDFSSSIDLDTVIKDIRDKYRIVNINNDCGDSLYYICKALYTDYKVRLANYRSYIEEGMNARTLMELRKSAILPMGKELQDFYPKHCSCNTANDVKQFRKNYIGSINKDYVDLNWQYYFLLNHYLGKKVKGIVIDFEDCFSDGVLKNQTNMEDYIEDFIDAHFRIPGGGF